MRPPLIAAKTAVGVVPLVGVTVSQSPSELAIADVNCTDAPEVEMEIGTSEIPWPGSVQKTNGEGLNVSVPVCAVAEAESNIIRAMAIREGVTIAGLLKDFSSLDPFDSGSTAAR